MFPKPSEILQSELIPWLLFLFRRPTFLLHFWIKCKQPICNLFKWVERVSSNKVNIVCLFIFAVLGIEVRVYQARQLLYHWKSLCRIGFIRVKEDLLQRLSLKLDKEKFRESWKHPGILKARPLRIHWSKSFGLTTVSLSNIWASVF